MDSITPIPVPSDADWERLHAFELKFGECWKNCASYCCKTNHESQDFSLMKKDTAGMVFMTEEYKFLERGQRLQQGFEAAHRHHEFEFDAQRGLVVSFETSVCSLGGVCSLPEYRPMICKFYPYYPVINLDSGGVDSFITGSTIDQHWDVLGVEHPCWLHRTKGEEVKTAVRSSSDALDHPYFVFHLGVASIVVEHMRERCDQQLAQQLRGDPRTFFKHWGVNYLMGKFIDKPVLAEQIREFHQQVESRYGEFTI